MGLPEEQQVMFMAVSEEANNSNPNQAEMAMLTRFSTSGYETGSRRKCWKRQTAKSLALRTIAMPFKYSVLFKI